MNMSPQHREPNSIPQPSDDSSRSGRKLPRLRWVPGAHRLTTWLAGLVCLFLATAAVRADRVPANCTGSGLGISLFTSIPDVHIGDTLRYSINVFNGVAGSGRIACDATAVQAFIVTPDGVTHSVPLVRTTLHQGESDFYLDVVSYVVRAQDIQPDGTLLATARDTGVIHQNDTDSVGGGFQGVNTEVNLPCVLISAFCVPGVGENGLITISGTVTNCGNNTLVGVVVTNQHDGGFFTVVFTNNLARGQSATFTGSYLPLNPCVPSSAILIVRATDEFTATPRTVTNFTTVTCQNVLTPGIQVTKVCPPGPVSPGQLLTFSGTIRNTGNVTLTNIVVLNNQPAANTSVFTKASLAPGEVASFTGSYLAPTNCSVADTLTATATSRCGGAVTSSASATCPILTTPQIAVSVVCPVTPVVSGGSVTYAGTVRNTGDITLNNVVVVSDRPVANTTVFTIASLAPGAVASFTSTATVPANACAITTIFSGTGRDICTLNSVTNTVPVTCLGTTVPAIAVTLVCPPATGTPVNVALGRTASQSSTYAFQGVNFVAGFAVDGNTSGVYTDQSMSVTDPAPNAWWQVDLGSVRTIGTINLWSRSDGQAQQTSNLYLLVSDNPIPADLQSATNQAGVSVYYFPGNISRPTTFSVNRTGRHVKVQLAGTDSLTLSEVQVYETPAAAPSVSITYTGTVRNSGNVTLNNVTVVNSQASPATVLTVPSLAPGATANFTATFTVPADACAVTSTVTATGTDSCSAVQVSNTASATCALTTTPGIVITQNCPVIPAVPGGLLTYTGSVMNSGNVTLTNVVVRNNLGGAAPILTVATLAPGASASFTGSFLATTNCAISSVSTVTGGTICGVSVTNTASSTCPILTTPQVAVTVACPAGPILPGSTLTYSGTVRNTGNITLTNVVVVSDRPGANSTVFTVATLAPGVTASFTSSITVPTGACAVTTTFGGTGRDVCTLNPVTNIVTTTCAILTAPAIAVTLACPIAPAVTGGLITYTGTVTNPGNVTLTNVFVVNNQPGPNTAVIGPITLAPGASVNFTASFTTTLAACAVTSTVIATGSDNCSAVLVSNTASATCALLTTPGIAITQTCPVAPAIPGGLVNYTGSVLNTGNITLTNVVVVNNQSGATPILTLATLAPGASVPFSGSYVAPTACVTTSISTATGGSVCGVSVTNTASATCPILTTPAIVVTQICPVTSVLQGGILTYSGTVSNAGNITLTNIIVVNNQPATNTVIFTLASLAPGATANFTGSYQVPDDCCVVSSTVRASGQGCVGETVTDTATRTCPVVGSPRIVVTKVCPTGLLRPGDLLTYSGTVSNAGTITLINVTVVNNQPGGGSTVVVPGTLAPGESFNYIASYLVPPDFCGTDTVTARGLDICTFLPVVHSVTTTCPVTLTPRIIVTKNCPLVPPPLGGLFTYTGSVSNAGNVTLNNVFVVDNMPAPNTPVIGPITLAPGASVNFSGSYLAPTDCCEIIDTVTARGQDICSGSNVTATATAFCPLQSAPAIVVVQNCPPAPIPMGSDYRFSGYVTNTGNVVLTNVFVFGPQGTNFPVLGPIELAPGESESFSGGYTVPFDTCFVSITTRGKDGLCGTNVVSNTASCPVATTALLALTQTCPVAPVVPGALLTYSGTVQNAGNITLTNVTILNSQSGGTPIFTVATLTPGAIASYSGSYVAPANCSSTSLSTATGRSICGVATTNTVSSTCVIVTTPLLALTQTCPVSPVSPGGLFTYTGSVSNAGNITLNNVVVTNSQSGITPLITIATLVPGASSNFTGSYTAPVIGLTTTSSSTARAMSLCAVPVTNTVSLTCPVVSQPGIAVVKLCPPVPVAAGGTLVFSGTLANTGNITLTNVFVVNNQPAPNTVVLGPITLAPGVTTNFTGSYLVPLNACAVADTLIGSGNDASTGATVSSSDAANCPIITTPGITITQTCPPGPVSAGNSVAYGGTVSNSGNITLTNVLVFSSQPGNTQVLGPITLAPGESAPFSGTFVATGGSGTTTNTTIVTNMNDVVTTNMNNVITTNNTPVVTTNSITPTFGTIDPVTGILTDRFNVVSNLHGLMFAAQDQQWGASLFYAVRHPAAGADQFVTISTAGAGSVTDRFALSSTNYDALTLAAPDVGYGAVNFYYLRHASPGVNTFGVIKAAGASSSSDLPVSPIAGTNYNSLAFAEADVAGYGANLFYSLRETNGVTVFGTIAPSPGLVPLDRYTVGTNANFDSMVFVPGAVSDWGTAQFAYLRHDTTGSIIGSINPVSQVVTDRVNLGTNFITSLTFTATDVGYGPNLFYYLRPERAAMTTNIVTTFTTNVVTTFTTNVVTTFVTNSTVTFMATNTVSTTGTDICQGRTVAAAANCSGPVAAASPPPPSGSATPPVVSSPTFANGSVSLSFPTESGRSYTTQFKNTLSDPAWTTLETVAGTGGNMTTRYAVEPLTRSRFYRVIIAP